MSATTDLRNNAKSLYVEGYTAKMEGYDEEKPKHSEIFREKMVSEGPGDKETEILDLDEFDETEPGIDVNYKNIKQGYTSYVKFRKFTTGLSLDLEQQEDTVKVKNLIKFITRSWGGAEARLYEKEGAKVFNEGGNLSGSSTFNGSFTDNADPSGDLMPNGQPLFCLEGNEWSAKTGGGTYFNSYATTPLTPDNVDTLWNRAVNINNYNDRTEIISNDVDTCLCHGTVYSTARRIFLTQKGLPGTDLNDINIYKDYINRIIPWNYIGDAVSSVYPWFLLRRQSDKLQMIKRKKATLRYWIDENNLAFKVSVHLRLGIWAKHGFQKQIVRGGGSSS